MQKFPLRAIAAIAIFLIAFFGFQLGVVLSESEGSPDRSVLVNAYYALSLFVIGGIDIGTPTAGPKLGLYPLWFAYFAAPLLAISTLLEAFLRAFSNSRWRLRRLKNHVVITGRGELVLAYLRMLRESDSRAQLVVVSRDGFDITTREEIHKDFDAVIWQGNLANDFTCKQLRIKRARQVLLLEDESLRNYETVKLLLDRHPGLAGKIIMRSERLRFMRAMASTVAARAITVFNPYQLAADTLVKRIIQPRLENAAAPVGVVIAGFGRFGQSILEGLQDLPSNSISTIALIEQDAERRVMVTREQVAISNAFELKVLQGDVSHPGVWQSLGASWDIAMQDTIYVLCTSLEEDNLRTALWLRSHSQSSLVIARLEKSSAFATQVATDNNFHALSLHELVEESMPRYWIKPE